MSPVSYFVFNCRNTVFHLTTFLIGLLNVSGQAQTISDSLNSSQVYVSALYINLGGGFSSTTYPNIGGTMLLSSNWGGSLAYTKLSTEADEIPDDYQSVNWFGGDEDVVYDTQDLYMIRLLYEIPTGNKLFRFGLSAGPSYVKVRRAHFTPSTFPLFSNYVVNYTDKHVVGFSLNPRAEFPFSRFVGMEAGLSVFYADSRMTVGIDLNLTLGYVREKLKRPSP